MVRVEATRVGYGREPTPEELADPEAQLSAKYIGLLQEAHPLIDPDKFEPTDEFMERLNENIEEVVATVPNINPDALKKMVLENPLFVKGWVYGGTFTEFHYLAFLFKLNVCRNPSGNNAS